MVNIAIVGNGHLAEATLAGVRGAEGSTSSIQSAELVWFCVDMPVDENDRPVLEPVYRRLCDTLRLLDSPSVPVLISSQLPVGTMAKWEELFPTHHLVYQPENIRKLHAVEDFRRQARMIVGTRHTEDLPLIEKVLSPFTSNIIVMSPESAEMTKHALNAFLAMEIAFANEVADICRLVGADVEAVFRGFRSDLRIGFLGPLIPGAPYRGGTLGRDVRVLLDLVPPPGICLIGAISDSNESRR